MSEPTAAEWASAQADVDTAAMELAGAPEGIARQMPFDRWLGGKRRCTQLVHDWLRSALELDRVLEPQLVLSLDVDGVLEDESDGYSSTGLAGAAALRLLQLGGVAVLLNTARSLSCVRQRTQQFGLFGGVSAFGSVIWDGVFEREESLLSDGGNADLNRLRSLLRADSTVVLDSAYHHSVRASRIVEGRPHPIHGPEARRLLDQHNLTELTFWVAPAHTDFADRSVDKGIGIQRLREDLGLSNPPLAAMGDSASDTPMLRLARYAFLPAGAAPSYLAPRGQRLVRCRHLGDQALWEAACTLVPNLNLQRRVVDAAQHLDFADWFPHSRRRLPAAPRLLPRLAAALAPTRSYHLDPKEG
jgi:3-deoxy-D-manno-octulosonate 8-phosphate phosphatase KdsC-like HAD superfamily phosphatase